MNDDDNLRDELGKIDRAITTQEGLRGIMPDDLLMPLLKDLQAKRVAIVAQLEKGSTAVVGEGATAVSGIQQAAQAMAVSDAGVGVQGDENVVVGERGAVAEGDVDGSIVTGDNNSVTHMTKIYQQVPGQPMLDEEAFHQALRRYLNWVERRYGRLNLRGVEKREQQVLSLTLGDIYVSLAASVNAKRKSQRSSLRIEDEQPTEPVDMNRLLPISPRWVITGGPGCGKTTYLHLIAATVARALRINQPDAVQTYLGLPEPLSLPIVIPLSEFNRYRRRCENADDPRQGTLIAFISYSLIRQQAAMGLPDDFFERLLVQGKSCLLLLDGLDEVANERERILVRRAVEDLAYNDGVRQIVVTSRTRAYQGGAVLPEAFRVAAVQPMDDDQVNRLIARWCAAVYEETEAKPETRRLQTAVSRLEQLRRARGEPRLADTPLLVTIVAIVHYNQRRLPDQRAELYEKCVEVLLTEGNKPATEATFELADWGGSLPEKRGLLAFLAYQMMSAGPDAGRLVEETAVIDWLRPRMVSRHGADNAEKQLRIFIEAMRERGSLLDERGGSYQFTHLTFQEFLCAYYLAETVRDPEKMVAFLLEDARFADPWWRETVLLTAGYLGIKTDETALTFINQLIGLSSRDEAALAAAELAGTAFRELDSEDEGVKTAVVTQLVSLLTKPDVEAAPAIRALGGDTLGRLGDPRPGVCTLEPDLIAVPGGPFLMGDEKYEITLPSFEMARCPVTNAQFQRFMEDGGYTEKWRSCWTDDGWKYCRKNSWKEPRLWDDDRFNQSNQPVVGVSWYEAVAYTNWLAKTTGKAYRLPTEAEWERAARHTDGRTYPWSDDFEDTWVNWKAAGADRLAAVGIFPQDTAVCGAQDMGGNVSEWCRTRWHNRKNYPMPYQPDDGREDLSGDQNVWRVWRGGAWSDKDKAWLQCAYRLRSVPFNGYLNLGFRVVCVPISHSGL